MRTNPMKTKTVPMKTKYMTLNEAWAFARDEFVWHVYTDLTPIG